ncbi:MAG: chemotaxis protein CheW [Pseudomonadota bacterium]
MSKDVLLIRSNQHHLAVPTDRLLEIVNLKDYHAKQQVNLAAPSPSHNPDQYRLWRNHLLPVLNLGHFLEPAAQKQECQFGLVYQASDHERLYLDIDHVFGITHIDTSKMRPVYASQNNIETTNLTPEKYALAFVLEVN